MATKAGKSLKSQNLGWLWAVVAIDSIAISAVAFPTFLAQVDIKEFWWLRASSAAIAPVVVLLITSLLPADLKAVLVFWRIRDALPGHRAFSVHAVRDPRIDIDVIRGVIGAFPEAPRDQNTLWYRLYKKVDDNVAVALAHRHFLLFRDLATISLLVGAIAPAGLGFWGAKSTAIWLVVSLFVLQYLATAIAARNNGVRLVTNVLALYSTKGSR